MGREIRLSTRRVKVKTMKEETTLTAEHVEQVIRALDTAWSKSDIEGAVALFTPDATVESPAIPRLLNRKEGVCRGRDEIRELVRAMLRRGKPWGRHGPPIIRGGMAAIEYMLPSSDTEQFSVDVVEMRDGRIQNLRAYLGWRAVAAFAGEGATR